MSLAELCRRLQSSGAELGFAWGWKEDPATLFGARASWVLYVDLPAECGQVSFHSPSRGEGPAYAGEWDGVRGVGVDRILAFCDELLGRGPDPLLGIARYPDARRRRTCRVRRHSCTNS